MHRRVASIDIRAWQTLMLRDTVSSLCEERSTCTQPLPAPERLSFTRFTGNSGAFLHGAGTRYCASNPRIPLCIYPTSSYTDSIHSIELIAPSASRPIGAIISGSTRHSGGAERLVNDGVAAILEVYEWTDEMGVPDGMSPVSAFILF